MHPSIKIFKEEVFEFINKDHEILTLADDCLFTEGPVWNEAGYYLFSDITANCIYKISETESKQIFISQSGTRNELDFDLKPDQVGSNGLSYDHEGNLLVCRHGSHDVALFDGDGLQSFIHAFRGKPFNSPNDIIVAPGGSVFFSDPPYGLKDGKLNPPKFQTLAAVYCFRDGKIQKVTDKYQYPNGVCLSPDHSTLYICSSKPFEKFVSIHDAHSLEFKGILCEENSDGIKMDANGNFYLCSKEGIIILNKDGERMALIQLQAIPANACFGGKHKKDLLVTARENVYLLKDILN